MTFSELQTEVRGRMDESLTTFYSDQDIKDALNEGYEEMSDACEWYERNATISLLSGKNYYDLTTVLSDTVLSPRRVYSNVQGRWMTWTDVRTLDSRYRQWETISQDATDVFMRGLWTLGIFPKPSADSGTIKFYYTAMPAALSASSDTPGFPQEFHFGIMEYALYDLYAQNFEAIKAMRHWKRYQEIEKALGNYVAGRITLDRIGALRG